MSDILKAISEDTDDYHRRCEMFGVEPQKNGLYGEHGEQVRLMEQYGTKDITPRHHPHPRDKRRRVHGILLGPGATLSSTDLYADENGRWLPIPEAFVGLELNYYVAGNGEQNFLRPPKKEAGK